MNEPPVAIVVDRRKKPFIWIDKEMVSKYLPEIGASAFAVYLGLLYRLDEEVNPSYANLAALTGLSLHTVRTASRVLSRSGLLLITPRNDRFGGRQSNIFTVLPPSAQAHTTPIEHPTAQHERCRRRLAKAVKSGRIKRLPCEKCGDKNSEGHHDDYSKPLQVRWLCRKDHIDFHNSLRASQ